MAHIGRLEEVDIRELWVHEQYCFSEWLSQKENISLLEDIIGFTLVDIDKETDIGSFKCDITAVDETSGQRVVIENQLEQTNHDHLGKLITHASWSDAKVIVWIVRQAREEHRSAIEWLNNNMIADVSFFLIEVHAYKIGDSLPAPKFEVIEQPNDFVKSNTTSKGNTELNRSQSERLQFWTEFNEFLSENKPEGIRKRKASTDHWYAVAIGSSKAHISITLVESKDKIGVSLYIPDDKDLFDSLYEDKDEIDSKLSFVVSWEKSENRKSSYIITFIDGLSFDDHTNYPILMREIVDRVKQLQDTFRPYINDY